MRAGGDTGSIGAVECFTAQACRAAAQDRIDALSAPVVVNWQLLGSECVARDEDDPDTCCFDRSAACFCFYDWSGDTVRRRENALIIGGRPVCDEWSRGLECLSPAEEFDGCDPKDPASCEAACSELDQRLSDDRARTFDAEIRFAACENYHCRVVTRVEDCCYAVFVPGRPGYDCSLSDAEILQMAYGESGPSCPASMCDAGASVALPADDADGGV